MVEIAIYVSSALWYDSDGITYLWRKNDVAYVDNGEVIASICG